MGKDAIWLTAWDSNEKIHGGIQSNNLPLEDDRLNGAVRMAQSGSRKQLARVSSTPRSRPIGLEDWSAARALKLGLGLRI